MNAIMLRDKLVSILSDDHRILGIGQTGDLNIELIPGKSDIDLFVLCSEIPTEAERRSFYYHIEATFDLTMNVCCGGLWGFGDILVTGGVDVMPMYFTMDEMQTYLQEILAGKHLEKDGRFYPVGRLASVAGIHVLYEKDRAWSGLKEMVNRKPTAFFRQWYAHEVGQILDEEDLGRCELRHEVLFFHQVLENALDHLLQALFAVNRCYFPSRKRTLAAIGTFAQKPADCEARLLRLIENGSREEMLQFAITDLRRLAAEIELIGDQTFGL